MGKKVFFVVVDTMEAKQMQAGKLMLSLKVYFQLKYMKVCIKYNKPAKIGTSALT